MKRFFFALIALCLLATAAFGQSSTSTLSGTVSDASGVIQNATVVIKDNKTNRERTVQTNESGLFVVPDMEVGTYTVTITRTGGFASPLTMSVTSGLPSGVTATFSPNPASGSSTTLTATVSRSVAKGTYPFTVTGTDGAITHTATATLISK